MGQAQDICLRHGLALPPDHADVDLDRPRHDSYRSNGILGPMAFAIMGGLFVATMLTLLVLPVFYITLYGAKRPQEAEVAA